MKNSKNSIFIAIIFLLALSFSCDRNRLLDISDLNDIHLPAFGETGYVSIPGKNNTNGMWNLWRVNQWCDEYFSNINDGRYVSFKFRTLH